MLVLFPFDALICSTFYFLTLANVHWACNTAIIRLVQCHSCTAQMHQSKIDMAL